MLKILLLQLDCGNIETDNASDISLLISEDSILNLSKESSIEYVSIKKTINWRELEELEEFEKNEEEVKDNITCDVVTKNYFDIYPKIKEKLIAGRIFNEIDEKNSMPVCVIREDIGYKLFNNGNLVGKKILFNNQELKIIGVFSNNITEYDFPYVNGIYISERYIANSNDMEPDGQTSILIKPISNEARNEAIKSIETYLNEYISSKDYYVEQYYVSGEDTTIQVINIISFVFLTIAGISIVSGGIGIMNVLLVSVNERIKEVGIRRAIGAKKINIFMQFILEGFFLILFSGVLAVLTSILLVKLANQYLTTYNLFMQIKANIILEIFLLCGIVGIIFSVYPAIKASKLNPSDALRN